MKQTAPRAELVAYLAVLPAYRSECIALLLAELPSELAIYVSDAHLDPTVKTGIPESQYTRAGMVRLLGGRLFLQLGGWRPALQAQATLIDLNPRSLTAWILLVTRRVLGRRTLVWGHLYPQAGDASPTAFLRMAMRRLASGTVSYTYDQREQARKDIPAQPVWVAPNALYRVGQLQRAMTTGTDRTTILYVGRFEPRKKVALAIRAFARFAASNTETELVLVGSGSEDASLRALADSLGVSNRVRFEGWIGEFDQLADLYGSAFCSLSPGFAGLGLTQSLGFGVPMAIAKDETHSPEIELATSTSVKWFASDDPDALARAVGSLWALRDSLPRRDLAERIQISYSAEAMALGLRASLLDQSTELTEIPLGEN